MAHYISGFFGVIFAVSAFASEPVRLATHVLPPYGFYQGVEQKFAGIAVDVVDCVMRRMGQPYQLQIVPWARAQRLVQTGAADGFFAASQNAERDIYAVPSSTIAEQEWRWYLLAGNKADPLSSEFRRDAKVGSFIGANMLDWLNQNGYKVEASPTTTKALLQMLLMGRVDAILANNLVMEELIRASELKGRLRSVLQTDKPLSVYFSKTFVEKRPGFLAGFNSQIASCRKM